MKSPLGGGGGGSSAVIIEVSETRDSHDSTSGTFSITSDNFAEIYQAAQNKSECYVRLSESLINNDEQQISLVPVTWITSQGQIFATADFVYAVQLGNDAFQVNESINLYEITESGAGIDGVIRTKSF